MAELRSRYVNAQVTELIARLGIHQWRISDEEKYFLHRYLYLSVQQGLRTLGIPVIEQDPPLPTNNIVPRQLPEMMRVPRIPVPDENLDVTESITTIRDSNGH